MSVGGRRRAVLIRVWVGFAALTTSLETVRVVSESIFVANLGLRHLPEILAVQAVLRALGAWAYVQIADRSPVRALLLGLLAAMWGLLAAPSLTAALTGQVELYAVVYALFEALDTVVKVHWGIYLLHSFRPREAAKAFPMLFTASAVGRTVGGSLVGLAAGSWILWGLPGTVATIMLPLAGFMLAQKRPRRVERAPKRPPDSVVPIETFAKPLPAPQTSKGRNLPGREAGKSPPTFVPVSVRHPPLLRRTLSLLFRSRLLQAMVAATFLLAWVRTTGRYVSLAVLRAHLDQASLARVLGVFSSSAYLVALVIQILVTPRVAHKRGPEGANTAYGLALASSSLGLLLWPTVAAALAFRFSDQPLKGALRTPIAPIFYYPFGRALRPGARALVLGWVSPASAVAAALGIELLRGVGTLSVLSACTAGLGAGYFVATLVVNRAYQASTRGRGGEN